MLGFPLHRNWSSLRSHPNPSVMKDVMQLLLIPPFAVVAAVAWNAWRGRERRALRPEDSVDSFRRRMRAIAPLSEKRHTHH